MSTHKQKRPDFGFGGDVSQMTALALFIILLAFFIMFSSMTGIAFRRSDAVLTSVRDAFGIPDILIIEGAGKSLRESSLPRSGQGTSIQDVAGAFENEIPGVRSVLVRHAGRLEMNVPINQMNVLTGLSGNGAVGPALQRMISFLSDPSRPPYRVRIETHLRERDDKVASPDSVMDQYLIKWGAVFIGAGVPDRLLSLSQGVGHPGFVTLILEPAGEEREK